VSLIWLSTTEDATETNAIVGAAVLSYALWRTIRPLRLTGTSYREFWPVLVEGVIVVAAIVATDYWSSPYVFGLVTVIAAAGFIGGIPLALQATAACVAAVAVPLHLVDAGASGRVTAQWAVQLSVVAMLAGHTRRLSLEARAETSRYAGRLRQLSDVNDLLLQLRSAAQTLPMSLDLAETLDSSLARIQELLGPDLVLVLLREEDHWSVARSTGVQLPGRLATADLPQVLQQIVESTAQILVVPLDDLSVDRVGDRSRTGLYARLTARQELIGLVAVERRTDVPFTNHDVAVLAEFCQQMAIGIDNARWFSRIGTLAAEQERSRIARDLHDRVGQSLALVGFELDRASKRDVDPDVTRQLLDLRENVRAVVTELRETLYDLRTDVSEERDLTIAMKDFLDRVGQRSGLATTFEHHVTRRLPVNAEREVWRIAQEAVFNAERHAGAAAVTVTWTCEEESAELTVVDDGQGLPAAGEGRSGGYGLLGMQERANAIGASLTLGDTPGGGTTVRLALRR
jgi:signal transduction histidine kinase